MAKIPTQHIVVAGTKPAFAPAAAGDTASVGDKYFLMCKNAAGSSVTLTLTVPGAQANGLANDPTVYTVVGTTGEVWAPLDAYYANAIDGFCHIAYSSTTSVTVAVVKR